MRAGPARAREPRHAGDACGAAWRALSDALASRREPAQRLKPNSRATLEAMSDERLVAGVDLGGTKILTLIFDASHQVVARDQRPTDDEDGGPEAVMQRMAASVREAAGSRMLSGIGISAAGP